jgi:tRNA G37 N-methylase Trm5
MGRRIGEKRGNLKQEEKLVKLNKVNRQSLSLLSQSKSYFCFISVNKNFTHIIMNTFKYHDNFYKKQLIESRQEKRKIERDI